MIHGMYTKGEISLPQYKRLIKSTFRLQLKHVRDMNAKLFIKMASLIGSSFPIYKTVFPHYKQMFISRHFKPTLCSYLKMYQTLPFVWHRIYNGKVKCLVDHLPFPLEAATWWDLRQSWAKKTPTVEQVICAIVAGSIEDFANHKDNFELCILYEDLHRNPNEVCR